MSHLTQNLPVKFSSTGPQGWMEKADVALETAELLTDPPMGLQHVYFREEALKLRSGIWRSTPYSEFFEEFPFTEFMYVLEGAVTLESENFTETYTKGDAFLIPKGFRGYWRQTEPMLKFYMLIE